MRAWLWRGEDRKGEVKKLDFFAFLAALLRLLFGLWGSLFLAVYY
jgi:hypothetical protein